MVAPLLLAVLAVLAGSTGTPAAPYVGPVALARLVRASEAIFVGRVDDVVQVECPEYGTTVPIARVCVERPLKGVVKGEDVYYLAMGTWMCDISAAVPGERALFFLQGSTWRRALRPNEEDVGKLAAEDARVFTIAHAGRGRMPLSEANGNEYAEFWDEVVMPRGVPTIDAPRERSFIRLAHLDSLQKQVAEIQISPQPYFSLSHRDPSASSDSWSFRAWGDGWGYLIVDRPKGPWHIELELRVEELETLSSALRRADESHVSGAHGRKVVGGPVRVFEGREGERVVRFVLDEITPSEVLEPDRDRTAEALKLWCKVRSLFEEPNTLDARDRDRACLEVW